MKPQCKLASLRAAATTPRPLQPPPRCALSAAFHQASINRLYSVALALLLHFASQMLIHCTRHTRHTPDVILVSCLSILFLSSTPITSKQVPTPRRRWCSCQCSCPHPAVEGLLKLFIGVLLGNRICICCWRQWPVWTFVDTRPPDPRTCRSRGGSGKEHRIAAAVVAVAADTSAIEHFNIG